MKRICIFLFILIGIASIRCAESVVQFRVPASETLAVPGASRSLILVDARVTDDSGNYVPGLKAEDFELYQDGRPQEIAKFYEIKRASGSTEPRTVVFIIDDLNLPKAKYNQVRTALRYFADKIMRPTDMVGIARTAGGGVVLQPLTSNTAELRASADRWQWNVDTARPLNDIMLASASSSPDFVRSCSGST